MLGVMATLGKPLFLDKTSTDLAVDLVQAIAESNRQAAKRKEARRERKEAREAKKQKGR